jgi:hypothetical protein
MMSKASLISPLKWAAAIAELQFWFLFLKRVLVPAFFMLILPVGIDFGKLSEDKI